MMAEQNSLPSPGQFLDQIRTSLTPWIGKTINVTISLTDRNFDRHGTSRTQFSMNLERIDTRLSGARVIFSGSESFVEVSLMQLTAFEKPDDASIRLVEQIYQAEEQAFALQRSILLQLT